MSKHDAERRQNQSGSHQATIEVKELPKKERPAAKYIVHQTGFITRQKPNLSCNIPKPEAPELSIASVFDEGFYSHILRQRKYHID